VNITGSAKCHPSTIFIRLAYRQKERSSLAGTEKMFPGAILLAYEMKTVSISIYHSSKGSWLYWGM